MNKKITIAVDGYSSTGKSTVSKELAKHLGYVYVDTGAMYRAVTLYALQNNIITDTTFDKETLIESLKDISLCFNLDELTGDAQMHLNGINVETQIRTLEVSRWVSRIAEVSQVRQKLVEQQQQMGELKEVVMDGRDIGTVVFPNAELKIFMVADAHERAQRRYKELCDRNENISFEEVLANVIERDHIDTTREDSPLIKAEDAIEMDNTDINKEDHFQAVLQLAKDRIAGRV